MLLLILCLRILFLPLDIFELKLTAHTEEKGPLNLTLKSSGQIFLLLILTLYSKSHFFSSSFCVCVCVCQEKCWQKSLHGWLCISLQKVSV